MKLFEIPAGTAYFYGSLETAKTLKTLTSGLLPQVMHNALIREREDLLVDDVEKHNDRFREKEYQEKQDWWDAVPPGYSVFSMDRAFACDDGFIAVVKSSHIKTLQ